MTLSPLLKQKDKATQSKLLTDLYAFISELHWCSLLQLLLPQNMLEQLVFSSLGPSILSWSIEFAWVPLGDSSRVCASPTRDSNVGHGPSLQVHKGMVTEGKGLQVTGQNSSEDTDATRFFRTSAVLIGEWRSASRGWSMHGVQRPSDKCSLTSFTGEPGNLLKETMPCLQRGHGMDPGGPTNSEGRLLVEQR